MKWNGNFQENVFKNLGVLQKVVLFFGNYFGYDHSELDIARKDDGDAYSKMN